jgi:hypothetical protein
MSTLPDPAEQVARVLPRRRVALTVVVDLFPVRGWGNTAVDFRAAIQRTLHDSIGHYRPQVEIQAFRPEQGGVS